MGKKLPHELDAVNTVSAALTGLPGNFIPTAISNVHAASAKSLESFDPRFRVTSAYSQNRTRFVVEPREQVDLLIRIPMRSDKDFIKNYLNLVDHGDAFELPADSVEFVGSDLFKWISTLWEEGTLRIGPCEKKAVHRIWLVEPVTLKNDYFDSVAGVFRYGKKSFSFSGDACGEIFHFQHRKSAENDRADLDFRLNFDKWEGIDLQSLPHFQKILSFFEKLSAGWQFFTALEIEGLELTRAKSIDISRLPFVVECNARLQYIDMVSRVLRFLGKNLNFQAGYGFSAEEFLTVSEVVEIIEGDRVFTKEVLRKNPTMSLIADTSGANIQKLITSSNPMNIRFVDAKNHSVTCFGSTLDLPSKVILLDGVRPKVRPLRDSYEEGDVVQVEWIPQDGFEIKFEYDDD